MKEKEGFVDFPEQQMIVYVEKEDGNFGPMQTGSYLSAHYLDDYFGKRHKLEQELREQLIANRISPVKYYMVLVDLSLAELASRTGIRKSRVKRHLEPGQFLKATAGELTRYAAVFNIPVANLFQVILVPVEGNPESHHILENKAGSVVVNQHPTANPCIVLTQPEERR
ncbi:MAG TPA: helix-turn-helix transcriptional regulator [Bacteroidales bacterium]|nr:helix-turn-helix transcriptional regulator [Bacteroidales bacterium]HPS63215.1 helix-turn-helix transcriptional regulator [Bacteroidales bacterium]